METPRPAATAEFLPPPAVGRVFTAGYPIRRTDVTPDGRLRLDALARYLQDVAEDDVADSGLAEPYGWLVRRCALTIRGYPRGGQRLRLATFCSATGPRWAERTTTVSASGAELIQARAVWAAVARDTGEPCALGPGFHRVYGPAAQGRRVSARLSHPRPDPLAQVRDWPLRASDFDAAGHVGNTIHWQAAEEVLAGLDWLPGRADIWLLNETTRLASARLSRDPGDPGTGSAAAEGNHG